ncbi:MULTISPECIES: LPS-assembly protein LptD [unclassified Paracoccus (in: a-proteobacteria)]|uniref:LPS-assembly protein LptD n=1 Tax=unclassified Paracoccus (in: a-proteobacteria) TaxID=2688777 RepID=UPI002090F696|nr:MULTISPECIES: LPS assembly protein LptD [unclassified Paracoccus (in: a-proteobacteria)]
MPGTHMRRLMLGSTLMAGLSGAAAAQTIFDDESLMPEMPGVSQTAPLSSLGGISALAPESDSLGSEPIGDRTPSTDAPEAVEAQASVTLPGDRPRSSQGGAATVLADAVQLQDDRTLIAAGGVVIWYQGSRLVASRVIVDGPTGDLTIEGPIHLSRPDATDPDQDTILIADAAQLDRELQDGIIEGARLVIGRELQLAAREAERSDGGRITELRQVAASSCQICASDPTPLWEIRARSITHDAESRTITFDHPQFRAFGVPLAYLPFTLSAPDPTVDRKNGFLRPEIRTTSSLGFGLKLPYFIALGDHADVTVSPYVAVDSTRTLELRYRQAFANGATEWNGAITRDDLLLDEWRGYVFGIAQFDLPRDYKLGVQVQAATDRAYLLDYDVTDADRLWSGVTLEQVRRTKLVWARIGNYNSLRDDEDNSTSPAQVADAIWLRRFTPARIGGEATIEWSAHAHRRPSDEDEVGRDVARASFDLDWRRSQVLPGGVMAAAIASLEADVYRIAQDDDYDDVVARADPQVGIELRWPLATVKGRATHIIEPVMQLLYSPQGDDDDIPNEDSLLVEFDEGNLFSDSRFPGYDRSEGGLRANVGLTWTRIDPSGWSLGVTGGRVFRARDSSTYDDESFLGGRRSDWLLSTTYDSGKGLAIANRALFDDSFGVSRNEFRMGWLRDDLQLSAGYLWIDADLSEGRDDDASELAASVGWQIAPGWWGNAEARYDFTAESTQSASLDVTYRNECITVETGISRRFTSTDTIDAETSFDLSVRLAGFGSQSDGEGTVAQRNCMR